MTDLRTPAGPIAWHEPDRCGFIIAPHGSDRCEDHATDRRALGPEPVPACSTHWIAGGFVYTGPEGRFHPPA